MDNLEQALLESENSLMLLSDEELITPINDILIINPETRLIEVPSTELLLGVFSENLVEKKYFKCPRIVLNNIDLYECFIFINYVSASGRVGYIQSENVELDETEQYILFDWDLTNNVFDKNKDGTIYFSVSAKQYLEDSEPVFATRKAQGKMYETVNGTEHVTQEHADIILQILAGMKTKVDLPKDEDGNLLVPEEGQTLLFKEDGTTYYGTPSGGGGTSFSGSAKDVTYDDTETKLGAENVQDAIGKLSEEIADLKENGTGSGLALENVTDGEVMTSVEEIVLATGITLNKSTLSFAELATQTLVATVTPSNATEKVTWISSNSSVATVENGVVTPISSGSCTITAMVGNYYANCSVTVDIAEVTIESISATYTGGNVTEGTSLSALKGITVKATYSNGTTANVTGYTLSGEIKEGGNTITVTYAGLTTTFTVIGIEKVVTYTITRNLTGCASNNSVTTINEGSALTETFTAKNNYTLDGATVSVTMGGADISSNYVNGVLTIGSVTGNVVITVKAIYNAVVGSGTLVKKVTNDNGKAYFDILDLNYLVSPTESNITYITADSYKNDKYQNYRIVNTAMIKFLDMNSTNITNSLIPQVVVDGANKFVNNSAEGVICGIYQGNAIFLRLPIDLGGYSTPIEYLQATYGHLPLAMKSEVVEKVIDPNLITSMTVKTDDDTKQYAQFGYSDLPSADIYNGFCSLSLLTGTNANLSKHVPPRFAISTFTLSCEFEPHTFEEFTLENVKQYLTENPLVFWYTP